MRALLIEVDFSTGKRAGGISPRDKHLPCHGWQNLDSMPGLEIRLVDDDRDLSQYVGVSGVTILEGKDAINAAIDANIPTQYAVRDMTLLIEHMKERKIKLDTLVSKNMKQIAQEAVGLNLAGVEERKPQKV